MENLKDILSSLSFKEMKELKLLLERELEHRREGSFVYEVEINENLYYDLHIEEEISKLNVELETFESLGDILVRVLCPSKEELEAVKKIFNSLWILNGG
jgi:hypothetical protein